VFNSLAFAAYFKKFGASFNISSSSNIPVYSWGAGSGGAWVGEDSMVSEKSQILIAILRD